MKARSFLLLVLIATPATNTLGQGTIYFSNLAGTGSGVLDAPVTNAAGARIIGPSPYIADLFWSTDTNAPLDTLMAAGFNQPFSTTTVSGGGYFFGATRELPAGAVPILGQVRVWDTSYGATYAQARDSGGEFGLSNPFVVKLLVPLNPAPAMAGLQGFQLGRIPEPSAGLLFIVGGVACCWLRKQNRPCKRVRNGSLLLVVASLVIPDKGNGQGTIAFANYAAGVNAPITNAAGNRIIGPGPYVADFYWSSDTNTTADNLVAAGFNQPFSTVTLSGGGYFLAASRTLVGGVGTVLGQVRVWDTTFGATYAQARDNGGEFGASNLILVYPTIPPPPPGLLTGLQGFQLGRIPEPSARLLVVAGGAVWCWLRKRNRPCKRV